MATKSEEQSLVSIVRHLIQAHNTAARLTGENGPIAQNAKVRLTVLVQKLGPLHSEALEILQDLYSGYEEWG